MKRLVRRILPNPLLSLLLVVVWCLLVDSVKPGTLVLAAILGLVIPVIIAPYWPDRPRMPRLGRLLVYGLIAVWDIVVANVVVAWLVLFRSNRNMRTHWVVIPLDLTAPEAITILAGTITLTPGTVSADLSDDGRCLLVHALDTADAEEEARGIKDRYERRLKEIFE